MAIVLPAVGVVPLMVDPPDHLSGTDGTGAIACQFKSSRYVPLEELLEVSDADGLPVVVEDALLSEELLPELLLVSVSAFAAAFAASAAGDSCGLGCLFSGSLSLSLRQPAVRRLLRAAPLLLSSALQSPLLSPDGSGHWSHLLCC